ncbi:MAG: hypothetical protein OHK0053_16840 [Microscillaceae bacterium]
MCAKFSAKSFLIILGGLLSLSACVKVSHSSLSIPNDVFFASRANILRATYQVPNWKDIMRDEFSIDVEADTTPRTNFLASGKSYIFGDMTKGEQNYVAFAIDIRNPKSLERFITTLNPELEVGTFKKIRYLVKNKSLLAWSPNTLILIDAPQAATEEVLVKHLQKIGSIKKNQALIEQNENFKQALRNDYDVALWINAGEIRHASKFKKFAESAGLDQSHIHVQANFDEGLITTQMRFYPTEKLYDTYRDLLTKPVNKSLVSHVPIQHPAALLGAAVSPVGMGKMIIDIGWLEKAKNLADATTMGLGYFLALLSGDVVIALPPTTQNQESNTDSLQNLSTSDFVLGLGLRQPAMLDSLFNVLVRNGLMEKKEGYYDFFGGNFVMPTDSAVFITKSESIREDFIRGLVIEDPAILEMANENWLMMYADAGLGAKNFKGKDMVREIARNLLRNPNVKMQKTEITFARTGGKKSGGESRVWLSDQEVNSLLAMLEVLKEVVFQTKIRLDPNYYPDYIPEKN